MTTEEFQQQNIAQYDPITNPIVEMSYIVFKINKIIGGYDGSSEVDEHLVKLQIDSMNTVRLMLKMASLPATIKTMLSLFVESSMAGEV